MDREEDYGKTLHYAVEHNARLVPDLLAVVWGDNRITWLELNRNVNRAANALLEMGVKEGDKVGAMLRNCNQFVEAFVTAGKINSRPFNINYRYKEEELLYMLLNADAAVVICHPEYDETVEAVRSRVPTLHHVIVCGESRSGTRNGTISWEDPIPHPPNRPGV
ncbi:MAG: AMP-binding protein [Actinomycetota bacterium]|nr:AMP-binding protein [Actinomycetota bacterium]